MSSWMMCDRCLDGCKIFYSSSEGQVCCHCAKKVKKDKIAALVANYERFLHTLSEEEISKLTKKHNV